jgi:hypothetical protein
MFVQDGFLYLIVTKHKLTVYGKEENVFPSFFSIYLHIGTLSAFLPDISACFIW